MSNIFSFLLEQKQLECNSEVQGQTLASISLEEVKTPMKPQARMSCRWFVVFCFLFAVLYPDNAMGFFDEDALKTTGIIVGITFGVALVIILIAGTFTDLKRGGDDLEEDIFSQLPVPGHLGSATQTFSRFITPPAGPGGLVGNASRNEPKRAILLGGRLHTLESTRPPFRLIQDSRSWKLLPNPEEKELVLLRPSMVRKTLTPRFSLCRAGEG